MKYLFAFILALPFFAFADDAATLAAQTNLVIESEESDVALGWTRQAILGNKDGIVDRSGQVVAYADAAAQYALATNIQNIAAATHNAVTNSLQALWNVTNDVPPYASHIALYLPSTPAQNLTGVVVAEGMEGDLAWQDVKYSQYLKIAPNRTIKYMYLDTVATVPCEWAEWDESNLVHRCYFTPPAIASGKIVRSYLHDIIGGEKGFDFGSALVLVDGTPTFTGVWTNTLDGTIHTFKNGVKIKSTEAQNEDK